MSVVRCSSSTFFNRASLISFVSFFVIYRSGKVISGTVNSNFHFIQSFCEMFSYHFPFISCLKCAVYSYFHLFRWKSLPTNDFELTVPDLYLFTRKNRETYILTHHFTFIAQFDLILAVSLNR